MSSSVGDSNLRQIEAKETLALRQCVLRPHQRMEDCTYPSDLHAEAAHFGAFSDGMLVSIASISPEREARFSVFQSERQFRLRGMATHEGYRGRGFGVAVLQACLAQCWRAGGDLLWCNARRGATGYYAKMNFQVASPEFELPDIGPHRVMFVERSGMRN